MKNIELKLINRNFYNFIFLICLIFFIASVYAFGTSTPSTFGHSAGELDLSSGVNGNALFNGNLNVIGEVIFGGWLKVGDTEINCDSNSEGSLKYNSVNKTAEYCNGTSWKEIGISQGTFYFPNPNNPSTWTEIEPTWGGWSKANDGWNTEELSYSHGVYSFGRNNVPNPSTIDITYASFIYTGDSGTKGIMKTAADKMLDMDTGWDPLPWAKLQFYQDDNVVWEANTNNGIGIYRGRGWMIPSTPIDLSAAGVDFSGTHTYYFRYSTGSAKWWKTNFYMEITS